MHPPNCAPIQRGPCGRRGAGGLALLDSLGQLVLATPEMSPHIAEPAVRYAGTEDDEP
ncbi:hypothetical protein AB0G06_05145 [Nonomuraea dietziae]|uniref:hypothetical protein n=1 Tax=Nonomuraea dietziae TaxID=65515 RepID=UPI003405FA26